MRSRWAKFIDSLSGSGVEVHGNPDEVFENLDCRYSEDGRYYHNWTHISACLDELESARFLALHPAAVEMAVWFHDAVYVPGGPDNEQLSAQMARDAAGLMNLPSATVREVENLVLATRYLTGDNGAEELCPRDGALIRDVDLSILGKPANEFDRYEEAIHREYSFVPERERWERRIGVLEGFLALPRIYEYEHFQERYEQQARRNLNQSVCRLRSLLAG